MVLVKSGTKIDTSWFLCSASTGCVYFEPVYTKMNVSISLFNRPTHFIMYKGSSSGYSKETLIQWHWWKVVQKLTHYDFFVLYLPDQFTPRQMCQSLFSIAWHTSLYIRELRWAIQNRHWFDGIGEKWCGNWYIMMIFCSVTKIACISIGTVLARTVCTIYH